MQNAVKARFALRLLAHVPSYATPARARAKPSFDVIFHRFLWINDLHFIRKVRPFENVHQNSSDDNAADILQRS